MALLNEITSMPTPNRQVSLALARAITATLGSQIGTPQGFCSVEVAPLPQS